LAALAVWERRHSDPLIDIGLLRDRNFRDGALLSVLATFALMGLLFTMPQLFQEVGGSDALGTGLRILPLIGGLLVGARLADKIIARTGARRVLVGGLALLAAALTMGSFTDADTGFGFAAFWISALGAGLGLAMPTAMTIATGSLTAERAGSGSALLQTVRQAAGTVGVAVLGSVLSSTYRSELAGKLPAGIGAAADRSVSGGVAAARLAGDPVALHQVQAAFVSGVDATLLVSAGVAVLGIMVAVLHRGAADARANDIQERAESPV
jgi:MFS family permease